MYLNPGNGRFKRSCNSEIYVDKTGLISLTNKVLDTEQNAVCISRPRRFGKSMAANMLVAYYGKECDSAEIFEKQLCNGNKSNLQQLCIYYIIYKNTHRRKRDEHN